MRSEPEVHDEEEGGGMERWLLTYADMITLLLALFVVLFALSTINIKKFEALAQALRNTFSGHATVVKNDTGLLQHNSLVDHVGSVPSIERSVVGRASSPTTTLPPPPPGTQPLNAIQAAITSALASQGLLSDVSISQTHSSSAPPELVIQILSDQIFYAVDSADLLAVGDRVVDTIASVLRTDTNNIAVRGYTDNEPIYGGPYATNWELSAERAVHVVERLATVDGLNSNRLSSVGYGETHPVVPNDTPAHQAENRRVDVVILAPGETQP